MEGKILIVDDNAQNLQVLGKLLIEEGYTVEFALSGNEALEWALHFNFDLFLLDIMMPDMNGYELCRAIKSNPGKEEIPVIFITANTDLESLKVAFEAGGIDYITKPFIKDELLLRVATHLELKKSKDALKTLNQSLKNEIEERKKAERLLQIQKKQLKEDAVILEKVNNDLNLAKIEIENKHKDLQDSIDYANLIQNALLPDTEILNQFTNDHFILYQPLNIVSGDFYWFKPIQNKLAIAAGDCTGHGVPGAFMSILGMSYLNEICHPENEIVAPNLVLDRLRLLIKNSFSKDTRDAFMFGMDISFCIIDLDTLQLNYSGANRPLVLIRDKMEGDFLNCTGKIYENERYHIIKFLPDKQPIGHFDGEKPFINCSIQLKEKDCLYLFTDGYVDQFGPEGRKFYLENFINLLAANQDKPMQQQKQVLQQALNHFKGPIRQIDDILVMGIQI